VNIENDIAEQANKGDYDMLIMGVGQSIYEGSLLGKMIDFTSKMINPAKIFYKVTRREKSWFNPAFDERTRAILSKTEIPVGIFLDKNLHSVNRAFVLTGSADDAFLIRYARLLSDNGDVKVTLFLPDVELLQQILFKSGEYDSNDKVFDQFEIMTKMEIREEFLKSHDLFLVSAGYWAVLLEKPPGWLMSIPSTLIVTA
ncbi:MAG TPA: hypothetical protein PLW67_14200, partial [Prolixibacteraceae bacterium]|nr:hypothetical protein [Prolixibacteraceae bacterium]